MRKCKVLSLLLGVILLLLCSCHPAATLPEASDTIGGINAEDLPGSTEEPESSAEPVSKEEKPEARYVNPDELGTTPIEILASRTFEDRTLSIEDLPVNEPELSTYMLQYCETLPDFEQYKALHSEEMRIDVKNAEEAFAEGNYFTEFTFHRIEMLDEKTASALCDGWVAEDLKRYAIEYHFTEYTVVEAEFTFVRKDKALDEQAQRPSGRYSNGYLWAKTADDESFKLYTVYWTD